MTTDIEREEQMCSCGAGHGSREGHTDWCDWIVHVAERDTEHNDTCPYALYGPPALCTCAWAAKYMKEQP